MAFRDSQPLGAAMVAPTDRKLAKKFPKLLVTGDWADWLLAEQESLNLAPERKDHVRLEGQTAAVATTPFTLDLDPGVWRILYQVRVTRVAGTSSSFQVTVTWTQGGVVQTFTGALQNGNLLTTREGTDFVIRTDTDTPVSYAVAYASVGAPTMQFEADFIAELIVLEDA